MKKKFKIDKEIYSIDTLNQAIVDFKEVSEINYNNGTLEIDGKNDLEIEEIFNEFMNYVIGLINE